MRRFLRVTLPLGVGLWFAGAAWADPVVLSSGPVVLPLTGLAVDLPKDARPGAAWSVSGSWSLTEGGAAFDARDVIDLKVDGQIASGTWVHVGYFNAGDCGAVVNELAVPDRWTATRDLFGLRWSVAGGTWDFENDLGKKPVIAMCTPREGRASLLIYHFFVADDAPDNEARLVALGKNKLLERVTKAWEKDNFGPSAPMKRPEIKQRGDIPAVRTVRLDRSQLDLALPDDGFAWLARSADGSDFLDRMAPAAPDVTLETVRIRGVPCDQLIPTTGPDAPPRVAEPTPTGLPADWRSLGTIKVDATVERLICRERGGTSQVVGFLVTPDGAPKGLDLGPYLPMLSALAAASDASPLAP